MVQINNSDAQSFAIGRDEYSELISGDLVECAEFHSHGYLIELTTVSVNTQYTDSGEFDGITIACGKIADDCFNVAHIGDKYAFGDDAQYFAVEFGESHSVTRDECLAFALSLLIAHAPLPTDI